MSKAILFDLDGVLVDACELHRRALNFALIVVSGYEIPVSDYHLFEGHPTKVKLNMLVDSDNIKQEDIPEISRIKQEMTMKFARELFSPSQPKVYLFTRLKRAGVKIGVVSNAVRTTVHSFLDYIGLIEHVQVIISNEDVEYPKPNPEGYLKAMELLGVKPEETTIVEDSEVGIAAARATGANVVLVNGPDEVCWELLRCRID